MRIRLSLPVQLELGVRYVNASEYECVGFEMCSNLIKVVYVFQFVNALHILNYSSCI